MSSEGAAAYQAQGVNNLIIQSKSGEYIGTLSTDDAESTEPNCLDNVIRPSSTINATESYFRFGYRVIDHNNKVWVDTTLTLTSWKCNFVAIDF